jgi:hypothetical protein
LEGSYPPTAKKVLECLLSYWSSPVISITRLQGFLQATLLSQHVLSNAIMTLNYFYEKTTNKSLLKMILFKAPPGSSSRADSKDAQNWVQPQFCKTRGLLSPLTEKWGVWALFFQQVFPSFLPQVLHSEQPTAECWRGQRPACELGKESKGRWDGPFWAPLLSPLHPLTCSSLNTQVQLQIWKVGSEATIHFFLFHNLEWGWAQPDKTDTKQNYDSKWQPWLGHSSFSPAEENFLVSDPFSALWHLLSLIPSLLQSTSISGQDLACH